MLEIGEHDKVQFILKPE
ncbi:hypothetical protein ABTQ33_04840 [Paucilactobacillus suebicus]